MVFGWVLGGLQVTISRLEHTAYVMFYLAELLAGLLMLLVPRSFPPPHAYRFLRTAASRTLSIQRGTTGGNATEAIACMLTCFMHTPQNNSFLNARIVPTLKAEIIDTWQLVAWTGEASGEICFSGDRRISGLCETNCILRNIIFSSHAFEVLLRPPVSICNSSIVSRRC